MGTQVNDARVLPFVNADGTLTINIWADTASEVEAEARRAIAHQCSRGWQLDEPHDVVAQTRGNFGTTLYFTRERRG